jgi:hypothetical protein
MATYKVWHDDEPRFRGTFADAKRWPSGFTLVASVEAPAMEAVFELTNHINHDWTTNAGVTLFAPGPHRSTSVGDVVVDADDHAWMVAGIGFVKIEH